MPNSRPPRQWEARVAHDVRFAHRLADALIALCHETAQEYRLSVACVLGALAMALGRLAGRTARVHGAEIDQAIDAVIRHLSRVATREYLGPGQRLQ